jgi:hypothetical protein
VRLLVDRAQLGPASAEVRLRVVGLGSLVRDLGDRQHNSLAVAV